MFAIRLPALYILSVLIGNYARQTTVPLRANFVSIRPATPDSSISLTLVLPSKNMSGLHSALLDISNPVSANYGQHLSKLEVETFVAPTAESVKVVTDWLSQNNLKFTSASPAGEMLRVQLPVQSANQLLSANFTEFVDTATSTTFVRTLSYTVPEDVEQHVKFIYPTTQFIPPLDRSQPLFEVVQPTKVPKRTTPPSLCFEQTVPECLQDLYNIPATPATNPGNSLAVGAVSNEFATQDDLAAFIKAYRPDIITTPTFTVMSVDNGITSGNGTLEASLDIDYTVGIATGVPTTLVSDGDLGIAALLDMANALLAEENVPLVLTVSYGIVESALVGSEDFANQFCDTYAQLGARGTSVFYASGDNGVYSFGYKSTCNATEFGPTFPSTCPYLTSVGGTESIPETSAYFSGGGFSNIFPRPSYQGQAVSTYLGALGSQNAGLYNASGRGFPDVSAQSVNFTIRMAGEFVRVLGTSASTPTFASIVALLNEQRLNAGLPSLGFINPLLYSQGATALNDITTGSNPGCGTQGFPAMEGWDPVTGLGTPDYDKLLGLVLGTHSASLHSVHHS